jgi:hypothetical protein
LNGMPDELLESRRGELPQRKCCRIEEIRTLRPGQIRLANTQFVDAESLAESVTVG